MSIFSFKQVVIFSFKEVVIFSFEQVVIFSFKQVVIFTHEIILQISFCQIRKIENKLFLTCQACSSLQKKLSEDLHGYGKGTDGSSVDRRLKKTGDFVLGNIFSEVGRNLHKQNPASCLGNVLIYLGELFPQLANSHVNYEICVEQMIISKLQENQKFNFK